MSNLQNFNARELVSKHAFLMDEIKHLPPGIELSPIKKEQILEIEKELKKRLIRGMVGYPFPPDKKEKT